MMTLHVRSMAFLILPMTVLLISLPAQADTTSVKPAAIIEDIKAANIAFKPMNFLFEGAVIKLGAGETLKLAYLRTCIVEHFEGGTVTIGRNQSKLAGGILHYREEVDCDGGGIVPTERQTQDLAGIVLRAPDVVSDERLVMVYGTVPVFTFAEPVKELVIERLDPGFHEEQRWPVDSDWLDLADKNVRFSADGLYRASTEKGSALFRVSGRATAIGSSVISRLVGL